MIDSATFPTNPIAFTVKNGHPHLPSSTGTHILHSQICSLFFGFTFFSISVGPSSIAVYRWLHLIADHRGEKAAASASSATSSLAYSSLPIFADDVVRVLGVDHWWSLVNLGWEKSLYFRLFFSGCKLMHTYLLHKPSSQRRQPPHMSSLTNQR